MRRLRREISAQQQGQPPRLPEIPQPSKPFNEMTTPELRKFLRELRRPQREAELRAGRRKPKNLAEAHIFAADLLGDRDKPEQPPPHTEGDTPSPKEG
jgi:hypothetical protein